MEQKETIKILITTPTLIISFFIWAFFLNASRVTIPSLVSFQDFEGIISSLLSFNSVAFLVFFSLSYAILVAMSRVMPKRLLQGTAVVSFAVSALLFLVVFPLLLEYWLVGLFYLFSLIVVVETAFIKFEEIKSFVAPRVTAAALSQGLLIVGIGVFVSTLVFVLPNQTELVENFEETIFSSFTPKDVQSDLAQTTAQIVVQTQTETLGQIISNPAFQKISNKEDADVAQFVAIMQTLFDTIQTPEYKTNVKKKIGEKQGEQIEKTGFSELIKKTKQKIPVFSFLENFFWLVATLSVISIFFIVSNVIIKPFGVFFGAMFIIIIQMAKKFNEVTPKEPPSQKEQKIDPTMQQKDTPQSSQQNPHAKLP